MSEAGGETLRPQLVARAKGKGVERQHMATRQGLYDPRHEHDACGVGFVAHIKNHKSHQRLLDGLKILENLAHRGAGGDGSEGSARPWQFPIFLLW